jgi:hypothetical protein
VLVTLAPVPLTDFNRTLKNTFSLTGNFIPA